MTGHINSSNGGVETVKQVTIMRHGPTEMNYYDLSYNDFMDLMLHKKDPKLKNDPCVDLSELPNDIEIIFHSPAQRSLQTANIARDTHNHSAIISKECDSLIAEVKFSRKILSKNEYESNGGLKGCREIILERWFDGENVESFQASWERAKKLHQFLLNRQETNILIITHGWYLRLLKLLFESNISDPNQVTVDRLKSMTPPRHCEFFKAELLPQRKKQLALA